MPSRLPSLLALACVAGATSCAPPPQAHPDPTGIPASPGAIGVRAAGIDSLAAFLRQQVDSGRITGAVAIVARRGQVVFQQAVGAIDGDPARPMTPSTLFRLASMTKVITAVAALALVDEGRLRLDDPVSRYLPAFRTTPVLVRADSGGAPALAPRRNEVRVSHLLAHTSGLVYDFADRKEVAALYRRDSIPIGLASRPETLAGVVDRIASLPLAFEPGTDWEYSVSLDVLGRVIEVASGTPLDEFMRRRLFEPLRMRETGFRPAPTALAQLADFFAPNPGAPGVRDTARLLWMFGNSPPGTPYTPAARYLGEPGAYLSGGAGLVSTPRDYLRFLLMLAGGGALDGVRILRPQTVALMRTSVTGERRINRASALTGDTHGLGVGIRTEQSGPRWVGDSPGTYMWVGAGHHAFWVDPQRELVGLIMTQLIPGRPQSVLRQFKVLTYQALER
jgi:CubicO group peptidase (beta-lactamase class C family)